MWNRIWTLLCMSAVCSGLGVMPADAGSSRVNSFALQCDGSSRTVIYNASGFPVSTSQFILGGAIALTDPRGGIVVLRLSAPGDPGKTVIVMGAGETSARFALPTFFQVAANASGNVAIQVAGVCRGGGTLRGIATLFFN